MIKEDIKILIDSMFKAGSHFGYSKSRRHPSVKPYIFGAKNRVEIIDLEKTISLLEDAKAFVEELGREGSKILFVGSKPEAAPLVKEGALSVGMPYMTNRWIGGTLTNFSEIKKRVKRFKDISSKKEKGELDIYTKKERLFLDRELAKLEKNFGGIVDMVELPKAMFVIDPKAESNAVIEAKKQNIKLISIASSDCNIKEIDYPVVANESSAPSIKLFVNEIVTAYKEGQSSKPVEEDKPKTNNEKSESNDKEETEKKEEK